MAENRNIERMNLQQLQTGNDADSRKIDPPTRGRSTDSILIFMGEQYNGKAGEFTKMAQEESRRGRRLITRDALAWQCTRIKAFADRNQAETGDFIQSDSDSF